MTKYQKLLSSYNISKVMNKNPKVILLGDTNVGKTSIIQTLLHGGCPEKMSNTLGACFHRYECDSTMIMDLWDTAGQEKFRSLLTMYYKNSDAVVIVFDLTDEHSFKTVEYWTKQIETNCDSIPCIVLVGNKIDLKVPGHGVSRGQIQLYLKKHPKWQYLECSAKQNLNIKNIFKVVGSMVREQEKEKQKHAQNSKMKIHPSKLRKNSSGGGSCC